MSIPDARLYLLFTPAACAGDPWATLAEALRGGVEMVQWRVKESDRAGADRAKAMCDAAGVPFVVNDDPTLAVRTSAHGVHLGQEDAPVAAVQRVLGRRWIGVSTHSVEQIKEAVADGATYVGFGPCFPTATKGYTEGKRIEEIAEAVRNCPLPLFAIGGIRADNLPQLLRAGVRRIAVSSAVLQAADPRAAAAELRSMLRERRAQAAAQATAMTAAPTPLATATAEAQTTSMASPNE